MYFDRFDVCEAWYLFAAGWHAGAGSAEYQIFTRLHRVGFKPAPALSKSSLSENGRAILAGLIRKARRGLTVGHF